MDACGAKGRGGAAGSKGKASGAMLTQQGWCVVSLRSRAATTKQARACLQDGCRERLAGRAGEPQPEVAVHLRRRGREGERSAHAA
jgi:hypothetical protein